MKHKKLRRILSLLTHGGSYWITHDSVSRDTKKVLETRIIMEIEKLQKYQTTTTFEEDLTNFEDYDKEVIRKLNS